MAALDKIHINSYDKYLLFKEWCERQPNLIDKYGKSVPLTRYLYNWGTFEGGSIIYIAPYYVEQHLIKYCPFNFIHEKLKFKYSSSYDDIKNGNDIYSVKRNYNYGKHFKCLTPNYCNKPFKQKFWWVSIQIEGDFMWYHEETNSWDFYDEFVASRWTSSSAFCKTIKALKRLILKWKLPIGTIVTASGRYIGDKCEFIVTK